MVIIALVISFSVLYIYIMHSMLWPYNLPNSCFFCVDAQEMVFGTDNNETDFLFTCCEGIKINLHSWYFIRNKLADEVT